MFIRLEFHHLVGHFFVVGVAQQMRGGAAETVRNLIYRGFVCSYRIETDSVNFNKATRGGEVNADTRSCFVSAKLLKLTVNCWCDRLCGSNSFGFCLVVVFIFVVKVRENVFPLDLLNKDRQNSSLPLCFWEEDEEEPRV